MSYYLNNYSVRAKLIAQNPSEDLGIVVVIPCYNEPLLTTTLQSLSDCQTPTCGVEIIVIINASEEDAVSILVQNKRSLAAAKAWREKSSNTFSCYFIEENKLPQKHAGVGLARKIGMDEAVRRFDKINNHQGIIACFDADAQCEANYLVELERHFKDHPKSPACSIHFEHPIAGNEFSETIYNGITQYELHLRYYKNGLKYAQLPYAYHTIGSSMAVRSEAYQRQNGMNKRKAGEDFYFLQKLIPLGNFSTLKTTKIIPSPRVSDRVPFGTGKAMQNWLIEEEKTLMSYHPQSFVDLKQFALAVPNLYSEKRDIPTSINAFLTTINFEENLKKIKQNSTSKTHFTEVFFKWFNAFKVLKFMHYARDNYYPNLSIAEGANSLLELMDEKQATKSACHKLNNKALLLAFRQLDVA